MNEKRWTIINYALMLLSVLLGFYLSNGTVVFGSDPNRGLVLWEMIVANSIFLCSFGALITINVLRKKYKPNYVLIGIFGGLFILNLISILVFKGQQTISFTGVDNNTYSFDFVVSSYDRVRYVFNFLAMLCLGLFILDVSWQVANIKQFLGILSLAVIAMNIVLIIISYFMHGYNFIDFYRFLFTDDFYRASVISVFATKNAYAATLLLGIIASLYLHLVTRKWYWFIPLVYIFTNIIHTISKSVIIFSAVLIIAYLLYVFFTTYKEHKKMNLIALAAVGGTLLLGVLVVTIVLLAKGKFVSAFESIFLTKGQDTLESRTWIWNKVVLILNRSNWVIGVGYGLFSTLLHSYNMADVSASEINGRYSAHSGYLQFMGEGGIVFLLVALLIIGMLVYLGIKNYKRNPPLVVFSLTVLTLYLVYMIIESVMVIMPHSLEFGIAGMFIALPILDLNKERLMEKQQ